MRRLTLNHPSVHSSPNPFTYIYIYLAPELTFVLLVTLTHNTHRKHINYFFMLFGCVNMVSNYWTSNWSMINPFAVVQIVQDPRRILQNLTLSLFLFLVINKAKQSHPKLPIIVLLHDWLFFVIAVVFLVKNHGKIVQDL